MKTTGRRGIAKALPLGLQRSNHRPRRASVNALALDHGRHAEGRYLGIMSVVKAVAPASMATAPSGTGPWPQRHATLRSGMTYGRMARTPPAIDAFALLP